MALWKTRGDANGKPTWVDANTPFPQPGLANTYGIGSLSAANTGKHISPGWVQGRIGTGPVAAITITVQGTGYSNGFLTFYGGPGVNANASYSINSITGGINSITINNPGTGYSNVANVSVKANNANSGQATLVIALGGRAGRKTYESLAVFKNLVAGNDTANNANSTLFVS